MNYSSKLVDQMQFIAPMNINSNKIQASFDICKLLVLYFIRVLSDSQIIDLNELS